MLKTNSVSRWCLGVCALGYVLHAGPGVEAGMLYQASLQNGDYGGGQAIDTFDPNHGGSPHVLGIIDGPDGVTYTPTEKSGRSNALINWVIPSENRLSFRNSGTVSFFFQADRNDHVTGGLISENYGFDAFHNGQATYGSFLFREVNDEGIADDTVQVLWNTWHNGVFTDGIRTTGLEYDRLYNVGFAWGGPDNEVEIWVDGVLATGSDLPSGFEFPWGRSNSGVNFGLGDNHERGVDPYNTTSGATFADIHIWDEYRASGATIPEPTTLGLLVLGVLAALRRRLLK